MRAAGLKVGFKLRVIVKLYLLQKIDKLKNQLTALVKQSNDEADLDEEQVQVLQDAGIIPHSLKGKGKGKPAHIIFVDTPEEGILPTIRSLP